MCNLLSIFILIALKILVKSAPDGPRHIVFVLADDIGWSDLYSTGGQFATPYLDELRSESVILDFHYIHFVCSISRSQFLTGRRAMNHGYGKISTFKFTSIAGIPIGQPTTANWFRDFVTKNKDNHEEMPIYKTYGIQKWHVGYSSNVQTPYLKGFDKYYGFYQSGISYTEKTHYHKKDIYGTADELQYDFWENEDIPYSSINTTRNTMILYQDKVTEYLDDFTLYQAANPGDDSNLYLYIGLQTLHGPLSIINKYTKDCKQQLDAVGVSYTNTRLRICEYTKMTDDWIEDLVDKLKVYGLWDDTLFVFTADNGADLDVASCNYPLRGSKFSYFDGNIRQFTFVGGGDNVIPTSQRGSHRQSLMSNLDWTPTLLSYSGLLEYIDPNDYEWDGKDQLDVILNGDSENTAETDSLLINIHSPIISSISNIDSAQIVFKYQWKTITGKIMGDGHIYKYMIADLQNEIDDKWINGVTDGWCNIDYNADRSISVELRENSEWSTSADIRNSQYLFDLTQDEGEKYNLMRLKGINGRITKQTRTKLIRFAKNLIETEINNPNIYEYYHSPIDCLWEFHSEGNPNNFPVNKNGVNGIYIKPFLTENEYLNKVTLCLDSGAANTPNPIPNKLKDLYLNKWIAPNAV